MTNSPNPTFTRRRALTGAAAGAGTLAFAGCAQDHFIQGDVNVARVAGLPGDPDDRRWLRSPVVDVELGPQDMALPNNLTPAVSSVRVRALHDGDRIAFLLEWTDSGTQDLTIE